MKRRAVLLTLLGAVLGLTMSLVAAPSAEASGRHCRLLHTHGPWRVDACAEFQHSGRGGIQLLSTIAMRNIQSGALVTADSLTVNGMRLTVSGRLVHSRGTVSQGGTGRLVAGTVDVNPSGSRSYYECGRVTITASGTYALFSARYPDGTVARPLDQRVFPRNQVSGAYLVTC